MFNKNQEDLFSYELSKGINLFLGAGFSILPNNLNETLPNAKELCEEVCTQFGVDEIFRDDLYSASEMVSASEYQAFLRKRFTVNNGINQQYYLLDKLNVKNIITTNIDNVVPTIYNCDDAVHYINDRSLYGSSRKSPNCIDYIPLNGNVCNGDSHLYFGKFELSLTEQKNEDLYKIAYALLSEIPVLFWGYSFSDNGVLKIVKKMLDSNKQNNIWIQCHPNDKKQQRLFEAQGCKVIVADTQQLLQWIESKFLKSSFYNEPSKKELNNIALTSFRIPKQYSQETNEKEDYYRLGQTCWFSIYNNHAFETSFVDEMWGYHLKSKNVIILGHKFSGKTTALMQCAIRHSDENVFYLQGDNTTEEIKNFLNNIRNNNVVVFIQNISKDIESFCLLASASNVSLIATSDKYSFESIRHILYKRNINFFEKTIGDLDENTARLIFDYIPPSVRKDNFVFKRSMNEDYTFFELLGQNVKGFMSYDEVVKILRRICIFDDQNTPSEDIQLIALTVYLQTNDSYMSTDLFFNFFHFNDYKKQIIPFCEKVKGILIDAGGEASYDQDYFSIRSNFFLRCAFEAFSKEDDLKEVFKYMISKFVNDVPKGNVYRYDAFVKKAYDSRLFYKIFNDDEKTAFELYDYIYYYDESPYTLQQKALCLSLFCRSKEAFSAIDNALSFRPNNFSMKNSKAEIIFNANKTFSTEKAEEQLHKATAILEECRKNDKRQNYHAILYAKIVLHLNERYPNEINLSMITIALDWLESINKENDKQIQSLISNLKERRDNVSLVVIE